MSFLRAWELIKLLEGGKHAADARDPNDTNCGIIQSTWEGLGYRGSVLNATDAELASAYNSLWRTGAASVFDPQSGSVRSLFELMPDPVDAFAFQFYINVPPASFRKALQAALGVKIDGSLGINTINALFAINKTVLLDRLITAQREHYADNASPANLPGLLNRVATAVKFC